MSDLFEVINEVDGIIVDDELYFFYHTILILKLGIGIDLILR